LDGGKLGFGEQLRIFLCKIELAVDFIIYMGKIGVLDVTQKAVFGKSFLVSSDLTLKTVFPQKSEKHIYWKISRPFYLN
jgi:hypothetical protein